LKTSKYFTSGYSESLSRTIIDILFLDRLECLQADGAFEHVNWLPEVPLKMMSQSLGKTISGRADWCLVHGNSKEEAETVLVVLYVYSPIIWIPMLRLQSCKGGKKGGISEVGASSANNVSSCRAGRQKETTQAEQMCVWRGD
jgi:hypothetical protein